VSQSSAHIQVVPPPEIVVDPKQFVWVGLLRVYTTFVQRSLLKEFFHSPEVLACWSFVLGRLHAASAPWLNWDVDAGWKDETLMYFKARVQDAQEAVDSSELGEGGPVRAIYQALTAVTWARYKLERWQCDRLKIDNSLLRRARQVDLLDLPANGFPTEQDVTTDLRDAMKKFREAVALEQLFACCLASRRLCHLLLHALTVHPQVWTPGLHGEIVTWHEQALRVLPGGRPWDAIGDRLRFLRSLAPSGNSIPKGLLEDALSPRQELFDNHS